jgi:hypothetical protein
MRKYALPTYVYIFFLCERKVIGVRWFVVCVVGLLAQDGRRSHARLACR